MIPEFITKIDWDLLREQKVDLLRIINDIEENAQYDTPEDAEIGVYDKWKASLEGILELIDALQDYATDELGIDEDEIFYLNLEE